MTTRGDKSQYKHALARHFRKELTPPEARLWARLKGKTDGLHFRRQHPIGPYIVDFYCAKANLIVEIDGNIHDVLNIAERDERRDAWLKAFGLEILRIPARDIMADPDEVATGIILLAQSRLKK